jgi:hypothetical protein
MRNETALDIDQRVSSRKRHLASVRLVLEVRQSLSLWKRALFLLGALCLGLALSVGILALAGVWPQQLASEFVGTLNGDSLRAVLVQMAPLVLVGLSASLAFRVGFWNLALLWQIFSGTGFPNQFFNDSWMVGFWRADHGRHDVELGRRASRMAQAVLGSPGP